MVTGGKARLQAGRLGQLRHDLAARAFWRRPGLLFAASARRARCPLGIILLGVAIVGVEISLVVIDHAAPPTPSAACPSRPSRRSGRWSKVAGAAGLP